MLDNNDLKAIQLIFENSIKPYREETNSLKESVNELKDSVGVLTEAVKELKEDVSVLKEEVKELKEDVSVLKEEVSVLKEDVSGLKKDVRRLEEKHNNLEEEVGKLKKEVKRHTITVENTVQKCIDAMGEGWRLNAERFDRLDVEGLKIKTEQSFLMSTIAM